VTSVWSSSSGFTLSGGDLIATATSNSSIYSNTAKAISSGKFYCELTCNSGFTDAGDAVGINGSGACLLFSGSNGIVNGGFAGDGYPGFGSSTGYHPGNPTSSIVGLAMDTDNELMWFQVNGGEWNASGGNPETNHLGVDISGIFSGSPINICFGSGAAGSAVTVNFGVSSFSYHMPTGYSAWDDSVPSLSGTAAMLVGL
jgi:hypothetical protein